MHSRGQQSCPSNYSTQAHEVGLANLRAKSQLERLAGQFDTAAARLRAVLGIWQDLLGPGHPEVGRSMLNLAATVYAQGQAGEAALVATRAYAILGARRSAGHAHVTAARDWPALRWAA